jgi:uncharacterized cofD-like protein
MTVGPRTVAIGGGTGCSTLLRGLRRHTHNLTAVVTVFDNGGSTGLLRQELGCPGLGDLRRCLGVLSTPSALWESTLEHRFPANKGVVGHTLGNLLLAGLWQQFGDLQKATEQAANLLRLKGSVVPVSVDSAQLCARLQDGSVQVGEEAIDARHAGAVPINEVFLDRDVSANPVAVHAIRSAEVIVLGPGDLYTSVLPSLLVPGIPEAIRASFARKVYVCNLVNKPGQLGGANASLLIKAVLHYIGASANLDRVVINSGTLLNTAGAPPIQFDSEGCAGLAEEVVRAPVADVVGARHHPGRLAHAVLGVLG